MSSNSLRIASDESASSSLRPSFAPIEQRLRMVERFMARTTLEWLNRRSELHEETGLAWYGVWERNDNFVGTCGAFRGRCGDEPEIGYEVAAAHRGKGYASEAAAAVTRTCHAAGHTLIWATIRPANTASVRVATASGYLFSRSETDAKGLLGYYVHKAGVRMSG